MSKQNISKIAKSFRSSLAKHSPEILTGIGISGMWTATVLAIKDTPKALDRINQVKDEQQVDKLKPVDVVKAAWKCYIPAVVVGCTSTACLIGASKVNFKRNAILATAYKLSESAFTEYKEKVIETIGEKKERQVREKVHKSRLEKNPVSKNEVVITSSGETLCYDHTSGRYFKSDIEKIKKAVNELNRKMLNWNYVSLNDFYYEIGLKGTGIGDKIGWNTDMGLIELDFSAQVSEDDKPCLVIDFEVAPKYDYDR